MNNLHKPLLPAVTLACALVFCTVQVLAQGMRIDLGKTETGRYMRLVGNVASTDGEITGNHFQTPEYYALNKGGAMYFAVDDSFMFQQDAGKFVLVNVEYLDAPGLSITLTYDAIGATSKQVSMNAAGSNAWKSYSFVLDDAYFGNRLTNGADFKLEAAANTMKINAVSVVPFEAYMNYGALRDSINMEVREEQGGDSKTEIVTLEGEECIRTTVIDNYLYVNVADTFVQGGNHPYLFVSVEYYDSDPTYSMRLQYDAGTVDHYKSTPFVFGKGWSSFRTYTFEISDAVFNNGENGGSDMRLQIAKPGLAVNQITIGILAKKPLPNTSSIAGFTAYKALESPVVNGGLKEWAWLRPYAARPAFAADQSRTDEFYRTWLLNNQNVPVVEAGEPGGVSDPGTPGLWDTKDLWGGISVLWDDTKMYISAIVKDNVVNTAGATWDQKDGFGFMIDVSHNYQSTSGGDVPVAKRDDLAFTQGEHFFFFPANASDAGLWKHSTSQAGEGLPAGVQKTVVLTDSGYVIEASVPLDVLRDGLLWTPGVSGDRDNFNPLFGWMINDNDGISPSSGRLMFGANSDDDEFWGTLSMAPIPLVDKGITIDLGPTNYENYIRQVEKGGDGLVEIVEIEGKNCAKTSNGYVYFDIDSVVINSAPHPHVLVSVEYYDSSSGSTNFRLQYDAQTAPYMDTRTVTVGNTHTWKTETFELTDALFTSRQNGKADFRLHCPTNDLFVNQVRVALADLWIDLGDTVTALGINETQLVSDGIRAPITVGGVNCKRNSKGYAENSRYFYHAVADSLIFGGNHPELFLTVEYYDTSSSGGVGMNYDGISNRWSTPPGNAFILNTNQWKLHTFYLPDANFRNLENGNSDFRITGMGDGTTFINRILIGSLDTIKFTGVEERGYEPLTFTLAQNYPNPFNPSTTIQYEVPKQGMVNLVVYSILGQKVAELVANNQAPGRYSVKWDATRMASGVYLYRLSQNGIVLTRKLMLLK